MLSLAELSYLCLIKTNIRERHYLAYILSGKYFDLIIRDLSMTKLVNTFLRRFDNMLWECDEYYHDTCNLTYHIPILGLDEYLVLSPLGIEILGTRYIVQWKHMTEFYMLLSKKDTTRELLEELKDYDKLTYPTHPSSGYADLLPNLTNVIPYLDKEILLLSYTFHRLKRVKPQWERILIARGPGLVYPLEDNL